MPNYMKFAGQALFYGAFVAVIGAFSAWPIYRQMPEGTAQIKLSFNHGGGRLQDCRKLTSEELAKLPSTQRRPNNCARERQPITVQMLVDGAPIYDAVLKPSGLSGDGQAETYKKFIVPAGKHTIVARLRDSKRTEGFDYESSFDVDLAPQQNLAIDFKAEQGGFLFR